MKKIKNILLFIVTIMLLFPIETLALDSNEPENGIPVVIIRVDESEEAIQFAEEKYNGNDYGTIQEMNGSKHHTTKCTGTVEIIVPSDFESEYDLTNHPTGEQSLEYIRGRGNSTWMIPEKKPYKIKYNKKLDILGMGKNKEWGLLANNFDPTLSHNALISWMGEQLGMEYTPKMIPVDVIMIGSISGSKYLGSYYLTELIDIGKNRLDIKELEEDDVEDITGGYLLSLYYDEQDFKEPENTVFETQYSKVKFINENPYFDEGDLTNGQELQRTYIRDYVNQIDNLIMNNAEIDLNTHNQINNLLDLKSTADFWLIQEFFVNFDGYKTSSNYLYKKENGKLYWGPLWDFDLMLYMVDVDEPEQIKGFNQSLPFPWLDNLRSNDPEFIKLLKQEWEEMNEKIIELTKDGGKLDQLKERQRKSWNDNFTVWKESSYYDRDTTIDEEFKTMKTIIEARRKWFNDNINNIGNVYSTITYEMDGELIQSEVVRTDSLFDPIDLIPTKEGQLFDGWIDKETSEKMEIQKILKDTVLIPKFISANDIEEEIEFFLTRYEDWVPLNNEEYENSINVYPNDYQELVVNNIVWTSSNPSVATVENNMVKLHSVGDTTITATIFNGTSKSYILHVYDDDTETIDEPEGILIDKDSIKIEVGETVQIKTSFVPNKPINPDNWIHIEREVSDTEVIDVDYSDCMIITGLKEGTSTITVKLYSSVSDRYYGDKTINVTVVSKKNKEDIKKYEYKFGENQIYKLGKDNNAIFIIDADYNLFLEGGKVYVDGELIDSNNYISESGSTKIELKKEYMNSLSIGNHLLKVEFNDGGVAETTFTIEKNSSNNQNNPQTDDNINYYILLFVISLLGLFIIKKRLFKTLSL